jgi:hypothetical protein
MRLGALPLGITAMVRRLTRCGTCNVPEHYRSDVLPRFLPRARTSSRPILRGSGACAKAAQRASRWHVDGKCTASIPGIGKGSRCIVPLGRDRGPGAMRKRPKRCPKKGHDLPPSVTCRRDPLNAHDYQAVPNPSGASSVQRTPPTSGG